MYDNSLVSTNYQWMHMSDVQHSLFVSSVGKMPYRERLYMYMYAYIERMSYLGDNTMCFTCV